MLMLNFDRKPKYEVGREFLIHTFIIWGHLDDSALSFLIYYKIKALLFNSESLLERVRSDMKQNNVITLNKYVALLNTGFSSSKNTFIYMVFRFKWLISTYFSILIAFKISIIFPFLKIATKYVSLITAAFLLVNYYVGFCALSICYCSFCFLFLFLFFYTNMNFKSPIITQLVESSMIW